MKLPKTLEKYRYMLDDFRRTTINESNFIDVDFEEDELFYLVELKFPNISDNQTNTDGFKTVKEASEYLRNCKKDLEGIFYDLEEVLEVLTAEELEEVKINMSEDELLKYFPKVESKKRIGRPKGSTKEATRNKKIEIRATEEERKEIKKLIKAKKKETGIKNISELLIYLLK